MLASIPQLVRLDTWLTKKHEFYPRLVKSLKCNFVYLFYFMAVRDDEYRATIHN